MLNPITLSGALCLALAAAPIFEPAAEPTQDALHFPLPTAPITIQGTETGEGPSLTDMLRAFNDVTGQNLSINSQARQMLDATRVGLLTSVRVPEGQVYSYVESMLFERGYVISELRDSEPRLLGVYDFNSLARNNGIVGIKYATIPGEQAESYAAHPALLVRTVIDSGPLDARQLANTLRAISSNSNLDLLTPMGMGNSLLVQGTGTYVSGIAAAVRVAVEKEAQRLAAQPAEQ